jgi:hypothetical protein
LDPTSVVISVDFILTLTQTAYIDAYREYEKARQIAMASTLADITARHYGDKPAT